METFSALLALCAGIYRSPVNSPYKGQWHWALMFSLICVWINDWVNNREAGDLRRHRAHYDVTIMEPRESNFRAPLFPRFYELLKQWSPIKYHLHIVQVTWQPTNINSWCPGWTGCNFNYVWFSFVYWSVYPGFFHYSNECHGNLLMISQHWFR